MRRFALLLLQLAEVMLDAARLDPVAPAPVVLNLASLGAWRGPVDGWIEQELVAKYNLPRRNVQGWLDNPAGNYGWLVRGNESSVGSAKRFDSKDNPFPSLRPVLTVDFVAGPTAYCTPKITSNGCVPSIGAVGSPSASAGLGFLVTTQNVNSNNFGLFFYSKTASATIPFQGAFMCVQPPILRTPGSLSSMGGPCASTFTIDFNTYIASGVDPALVPGLTVYLQNWFRDPPEPISGSGLSNAITFTIGA